MASGAVREPSSVEGSEAGSTGKTKKQKTNHVEGHDGTDSPRPIRRAARACETCRKHKLRCLPPASANDLRCARCARMQLVCVYSNPGVTLPVALGRQADEGGNTSRPPANRSNNEPEPRHAIHDFSFTDLQSVVGHSALQASPAGLNPSGDHIQLAPILSSHRRYEHPPRHGGSLDALAHYAATAETTSASGPLPSIASFTSLPSVSTAPSGSHETYTFMTAQSARSPARPFADASTFDHQEYQGESAEYGRPSPPPPPLAKARRIPKYSHKSRLGAMTDPAAHEAPFRPLTYNPDIYCNREMATRRASPEASAEDAEDDSNSDFEQPLHQPGTGSYNLHSSRAVNMTMAASGHDPAAYSMTALSVGPERRGDPIARKVFTETEARALFAFFCEEIHVFCPILEEPLSFATVRQRSSFLFCVVLALAARVCVEGRGSRTQSETGNTPASAVSGDTASPDNASGHLLLEKHKVKLCSRKQWHDIRSLAMSSYLQTVISKVHRLEDVQATLLLAAWGLLNKGASPDPWMLTGSGYRLARRLGVHMAPQLLQMPANATGPLVAMAKTYLLLYAFDRLLTCGFGRPETEGFPSSTLDTSPFIAYLDSRDGDNVMKHYISQETAAFVCANVELATIAREYSTFVSITIKSKPLDCKREIERIGELLDHFSKKWLAPRAILGKNLGVSGSLLRVLYDHIRLCLHSVPLKAADEPMSMAFLSKINLSDPSFLRKCIQKTEDSCIGIIQAYADDLRDDSESVLCYAYDYISLSLAYSSYLLLRLASTGVCGLGNLGQTRPVAALAEFGSASDAQREACMDLATARRYCASALTSLIRSDRSANRFNTDMAVNLSSIAQGTGMVLSEWLTTRFRLELEKPAAPSVQSANAGTFDLLSSLIDFNAYSSEVDHFLSAPPNDDAGLYTSNLFEFPGLDSFYTDSL